MNILSHLGHPVNQSFLRTAEILGFHSIHRSYTWDDGEDCRHYNGIRRSCMWWSIAGGSPMIQTYPGIFSRYTHIIMTVAVFLSVCCITLTL